MPLESEAPRDDAQIELRPPQTVMRLDRMGSMFQTRLSFMRVLLRRMARENWRFQRPLFDLDDRGFGTAVYTVTTPLRAYSLVAFSHDLDPEQRTDRVIAEAWDATFNLYHGTPNSAAIARLRAETPKQENGRFTSRELVLSRANKSVRLFEHVRDRLAEGRQPDADIVSDVGYLMRTTAVYGSGKFGCADRSKVANWDEARNAFQLEMLTVYLIRMFSIDLVEHVALAKGGATAVPLSRDLRRFLGIGNATGLGMAPFLVNHQILLHNWVTARETALQRVRELSGFSDAAWHRLQQVADQARLYIDEWRVEDEIQTARIETLREDLAAISDQIATRRRTPAVRPLDALYRWGEVSLSLEGQELLVSLIMEPFPELVDDMSRGLNADRDGVWDPTMSAATLKANLLAHYEWALAIDFNDRKNTWKFWYYSEEKFEPRFGNRYLEPGAEFEMPLAIARDISRLHTDLAGFNEEETVAAFVLKFPQHRHVVQRIQTTARYPYGEIRDNLTVDGFRPIDMLRFKLAYFGASKFDPKSDLWTRITMYQGAPFPDELAGPEVDDWMYRPNPRNLP